jgi:hypothetical protein
MAIPQRNTHRDETRTIGADAERAEAPYTQADFDFIDEVTADSEPITYVPRASLIPTHAMAKVRQAISDLNALALLDDKYSFPWVAMVGTPSQAELMAEFDKLVMQIESGYVSYMASREVFCMLSLALNSTQLQAPAFRPQPPIPRTAADRTAEHLVIQRDRIVIDCHWLHCTKSKVCASEGAWRGIVEPSQELQVERIERFAATKIANDYRAESVLSLSVFQQTQLVAIRGNAVHQAFKNLRTMVIDGAGQRTAARFKRIERAISDWSSSQPRFGQLQKKYRAYAMASELLPGAPVTQKAHLAGMILGEPVLSESAARQTLKTLERLISRTVSR